jgi:hypothetical protein
VKLLTLEDTVLMQRGRKEEARALSKIENSWGLLKPQDRHPGWKHCLWTWDSLIFKGRDVDVRYMAIVTMFYGQDLASVSQSYPQRRFPLGVAKAVTRQTLLGLDFIHDCGYIHASEYQSTWMPSTPISLLEDLCLDNIVQIPLSPFETVDRYLQDQPIKMHPPVTNKSVSPDNEIITFASQPLPLEPWVADGSNADICLIGFGDGMDSTMLQFQFPLTFALSPERG